jgi:hypothetical protein
MNPWLVAGVIAVLVLGAIIVFGTRRSRRADEVLGQLPSRTTPAGAANPTEQRSLANVFHELQVARQTGTLNVTSGERAASFYFLFGHLFHAVNGDLTGEAAVRECLTWPNLQYGFDKVSKLPLAETIERPIDQVLAG